MMCLTGRRGEPRKTLGSRSSATFNAHGPIRAGGLVMLAAGVAEFVAAVKPPPKWAAVNAG